DPWASPSGSGEQDRSEHPAYPPPGQEPYGRPPYGQDPYGQPQHGQPQHGQPQYGQPQHGQPQYGQAPYGQPQYGQPQYGQPQYGQAPYGQPQYGQDPYGQPPYGQMPYGQADYGPTEYGHQYGQQYGQAGYGADGPYGGYQRRTSGKAVAALWTGIGLLVLSLCGVGVFGIVPIVLGVKARREIRASSGQQTGDGMALAGVITGALAFVVSLALIVGVVLLLASGSASFENTSTSA
ncbi:MAG: hypothetical protein QOF53_1915, partial [Nocardioidaceae bacterium]|nr:hypothetical protein [Nocardioidaceae bacterium]